MPLRKKRRMMEVDTLGYCKWRLHYWGTAQGRHVFSHAINLGGKSLLPTTAPVGPAAGTWKRLAEGSWGHGRGRSRFRDNILTASC